MFGHIQNAELRSAFEGLKRYVDRNWGLAVIGLVVVLVLTWVVGIDAYETSRAQDVEQDSWITNFSADFEDLQDRVSTLEQSGVVGVCQNCETSAEVPEEQVAGQEDVLVVEVPVALGYSYYDPLWEYLEYGNTVEYFHPEGRPIAKFYFQSDGVAFYKGVELDPPEFRAFIALFPNGVTADGGYTVNATVRGSEVLSINWVEDANGETYWEEGTMVQLPRELNPLEKWAVESVHGTDMEDFCTKEWFDTMPTCDAHVSGCDYVKWSPAEEYARAEAFANYVTDPENAVWVEIWGAVDACYRWADAETGDLLQMDDPGAGLYEIPKSGWVALEVAEWYEGFTCTTDADADWETTYTIKVTPGFVIGIDQGGFIFKSGPLGWALDYEEGARRTEGWSQEKLMGLLTQSQPADY